MEFFPPNPEFLECVKDISQKDIDECPFDYSGQYDFKAENSVFYHIPTISKKFTFVASFDLDWTLAYNEQALFPKNPEDIQILPNRRELLVSLMKRGYTLVIFTNQFAKSKAEKEKKMKRVQNFLMKLSLPVFTFISTEKDSFRKPEKGMYNLFSKYLERTIEKLIYVGDALGRPQDFSDSDLEFGKNISAKVLSPEEVFKSTDVPPFSPEKELVIFVGMAGSGKSRYYSEFLSDHTLISQDLLKTKPRVLKEFEKALLTGKSIVIDNTNPSQEGREVFYHLAQKKEYKIKVLYFLHNGTGFNALREKKVPTIAYHVYFKNLTPPTQENTPGEVFKVWHVYKN